MKEEFFLENKISSEAEKERASDSCLEGLIEHINEYKDFYKTKFVLDLENEEFGFSEEEQRKMTEEIQKLKENILDEYENNNNLKVKREGQINHIMDNSILVNAGGQAIRYERGKPVSSKAKKTVKEEMEILNYYASELNENPELIAEELDHEDGHLHKFAEFFNGKINTKSPSRILLFKFFRDLEKGAIKKDDFSKRLEEIDEKTGISNFLDLRKLEQKGILLEREDGEETYKYILNL